MHDVMIVGLPLVVILAGILLNRAEVRELRGEMKDLRGEIRELRSEMNSRFNAVDAELRYFHGYAGKLEGRIEAMEKRQS
jgi:hypothetical protein